MVKRFFTLLQREISGLHQAAYLLGVFAIFSQLLGLVRDRLLAGTFGAGEALDIYYAAFRIPDFIFVTVASVVSVSVLIPFLVERMGRDRREAQAFISSVFTFFFAAIVGACAIVFVLMPTLVPVVFPGFAEGAREELVFLARLLLLSPILLGLSNIAGSITQVFERYFLYALSPILYNVGIIAGIVFLAPTWGIRGVVYGVLVGAALHLAIQLPSVLSAGFLPRLRFAGSRVIRSVLSLSVPRTITLGMSHLVILVLIALASLLSDGSITVFSFSYNLQSVPLSVIGVSYSLAAFPTLSRLYAAGDRSKFFEQVVVSIRHIIFWSVPVAVLFIVLRAQIVRTILGAGEFGWPATRLTAAALALFALSVIFQNLSLLIVRAYYSAGRTAVPLIVGILSGAFSIASAFFLIALFNEEEMFRYFIEALLRVSDISGTAILMLPLAFSLGQIINCFLLWAIFEKGTILFSRPIIRTLSQSFAAAVVMGFASWAMLNLLDDVFDINTFWGIFLQGLLAGLAGLVVHVILLLLLKNPEIKIIWKTIAQKFWKSKPDIVGPDPEIL